MLVDLCDKTRGKVKRLYQDIDYPSSYKPPHTPFQNGENVRGSERTLGTESTPGRMRGRLWSPIISAVEGTFDFFFPLPWLAAAVATGGVRRKARELPAAASCSSAACMKGGKWKVEGG